MKHARRQARLYLNHVVYQMVKSQMIKEPMYQAARFVYLCLPVYIDNYVKSNINSCSQDMYMSVPYIAILIRRKFCMKKINSII